MTDYYRVLGIKRSSSLREVKRSFRKKVKKLHPDLRSAKGYTETDPSSDEQMRLLLKAYEVLGNPRTRQDYDTLLRYFHPVIRHKFNYREFLRNRRDDLFSQAKLIFYDLLNSHAGEALAIYEELCSSRQFKLERYMARGDYMDCAFLLAEEFAERKEYVKAMDLLKQIYLDELERPYFKHFLDEIVFRMKQIACVHLGSVVPPEKNLRYLEELLTFGFPKKDKALFYKKMAEIYLSMGQTSKAVDSLQRGLAFDKRLSGVKKLKEKIGYPEIHVAQ